MSVFPISDLSILDQMNLTTPKFTILDNGQRIDHAWYLTGGGDQYYPFFLEAIQQHGKPHYTQAFEWCVGHGRIGWEIITKGICDKLSFSDCYDLAVETGLKNAKELGYENVVQGYITPTISKIPDTAMFDLVVGNPPNATDKDYMIQQCQEQGQGNDLINLALRLTVDQGFETHRDFFKYIKHHLNPDADIFITLQRSSVDLITQEISGPENFELISTTDMFPVDPGLKIAHFKYLG